MKHLSELTGKSKRRHARMLRKLAARGILYVREDPEFRMAIRLHSTGALVAQISKWNLFRSGSYMFRELELHLPGNARSDLPTLVWGP